MAAHLMNDKNSGAVKGSRRQAAQSLERHHPKDSHLTEFPSPRRRVQLGAALGSISLRTLKPSTLATDYREITINYNLVYYANTPILRSREGVSEVGTCGRGLPAVYFST